MKDLDSAIENLEAWEAKEKGQREPERNQNRVLIGRVEQFFDRLSVVAISLSSDLRVGDIIEIGDEEEAVRQRVSSMQIDRKDVTEAYEGASVGIKINHPVRVNSDVYRIRAQP